MPFTLTRWYFRAIHTNNKMIFNSSAFSTSCWGELNIYNSMVFTFSFFNLDGKPRNTCSSHSNKIYIFISSGNIDCIQFFIEFSLWNTFGLFCLGINKRLLSLLFIHVLSFLSTSDTAASIRLLVCLMKMAILFNYHYFFNVYLDRLWQCNV